jgi:hypothetical protein
MSANQHGVMNTDLFVSSALFIKGKQTLLQRTQEWSLHLFSRQGNYKFFHLLPEEFRYCIKHLIHQRNSQRRNFLRRVFSGYISFYVPIKSRLFTIPDNTVLSNSIGIPNVSLSSFLPRSKEQQSFVHKSLEGEDIPGDLGPPFPCAVADTQLE